MSLRPRFSLLTLLILTALVAVGVKLWYGPHHVVERPWPEMEVEYFFTREWQGNKQIVGPKIRRYKSHEGTVEHFEVTYYRAGIPTAWARRIYVKSETKEYCYLWTPVNAVGAELTTQEEAERGRVIEKESQRLQDLGHRYEPSIIKN
jgi:hypothetical protein